MKATYHWLLNKFKNSSEKSKWQIKEPEDRSDSVEHETFIQTRLKNNGLILGASVRGKNHAHNGRWRDDAFHFDETGGFTIMAVADGVGSCPLSRAGSGIACASAVSFVKNYLNQHEPARLSDIHDCLEKSVLHAIASIEEEAQTRQVDAGQLSTTLLLVVHGVAGSESFVASLQVGDGTVATMNSAKEVRTLGQGDYGEYAGQSVFLTSTGVRDQLRDRVVISETEDLEYIAMMTDGIADDYFPLSKGLKIFFEQMESSVLNSKHAVKSLAKWIRYEKVGSYDDRTLFILSL